MNESEIERSRHHIYQYRQGGGGKEASSPLEAELSQRQPLLHVSHSLDGNDLRSKMDVGLPQQ